MNRHFRCALITGASSGLGAEFAQQLAAYCDILILVARRRHLLDNIAHTIAHSDISQPPAIHIFASDLSSSQERQSLIAQLKEKNLSPDLLINNAGLGDYGEFSTATWERSHSLLEVNITALSHLTHAFLTGIITQQGAIINISSLACLLPIPDFALYAASKSFVTSFSEALRMELASNNVSVLAVCPGPVATNFGNIARREEFTDDLMPGKSFFYTTIKCVVSESIAALSRNKPRLYPNAKIRFFAFILSHLPQGILRAFMSLRPRKTKKENIPKN